MRTGLINRACLIVLLLVLSILSTPAFSQTVISGRVVQAEDGDALPGAFVLGYSSSVQKAYAYSGVDGSFSLKVPEGVAIDELRVSILGFAPKSVPLGGKTSGIEVRMFQQKTEIKGASVSAAAMEQKGDTLTYSVGAFKDGSEKVLGDILEKLPGISVTTSGGILHNGNYIGKFYVEGMDLMGSRYGIVTKNLSAEDIASVEVYRKHQPMKVLEGYAYTDKSAVNIILKKDKVGRWMFTGDASAGFGKGPLFDVKAMFTYFSSRKQDLLLLKGNNTGRELSNEMREQSYFGRTGIFLISSSEMDSDFRTELSPTRSFLALPEEYWKDNLSGMMSLNHLQKLGDDKTIRLSFNMLGERFASATSAITTVSLPDESAVVISQGDSLTDGSGYFSGTALYENNSCKRFFSNELALAGQIRSVSSRIASYSVYDQNYSLPSLKLSNSLRSVRRSSAGHALELNSVTRYAHRNHSATYVSAEDSLAQSYRYNDLGTDFKVSFSRRLWKMMLRVSAGAELAYKEIEAYLDGVPEDVPAGGHETMRLFSACPYVRLSSSFKVGGFTVSPSLPFSVKYISLKDAGEVFYPVFNPYVSAKRSIGQSFELNMYAGYSMSYSGETSLLDSYVMRNYRTFSKPDSLRIVSTLRGGCTLSYSDISSMLFANLSLHAAQVSMNRSLSSIYSSFYTVTEYLPVKSMSSTYGANGNVKKYFGVKTLVVDVSGGIVAGDSESYLQGSLLKYRRLDYNAGLSLTSNPVKWLSMFASGKYQRDVYSGDLTSESSSLDIVGRVSIKPVSALTLETTLNYLWNKVPGVQISNIPLLKATVSWAFPRFTVFVQCRNILGATEFRREFQNEYRTESLVTALRGREYLAGIRMSL